VQGFDRLVRGIRVSMNQEKKEYTDQELQYRISAKLDTIFFNSASHGIWKDSLQIDLGPLFARLVADYGTANISNIPPDIMKLQAESANIKVKLYFRYINLHREEDLIEPVGYGFDLLYKINKTEHDPLNIIN